MVLRSLRGARVSRRMSPKAETAQAGASGSKQSHRTRSADLLPRFDTPSAFSERICAVEADCSSRACARPVIEDQPVVMVGRLRQAATGAEAGGARTVACEKVKPAHHMRHALLRIVDRRRRGDSSMAHRSATARHRPRPFRSKPGIDACFGLRPASGFGAKTEGIGAGGRESPRPCSAERHAARQIPAIRAATGFGWQPLRLVLRIKGCAVRIARPCACRAGRIRLRHLRLHARRG